MKILVVGSGGREHAIAWRLAQSPQVQKIYVASGNAGTQIDSRLENIAISDIQELIEFVKVEKITQTIVGPESPLASGIVDAFRAQGLNIFGPTQKAAQLESSKAFAKNFMSKYNIPTAAYAVFEGEAGVEPANIYVRSFFERIQNQNQPCNQDYQHISNHKIVLKADGLAAGKGVFICDQLTQAQQALHDIFAMPAGAKVVIEEFIDGEEASFIVMCDGVSVLPLATSQDHKRLLDADMGPNTGGMGAYSPAPVVTPDIHAKIMREVIEPTIKGMQQEGIPYTGFLYAGIMIDAAQNIKVLEFNCRLGDPEAQVIMARLKSDFADVLKRANAVQLNTVQLEWDRRYAIGVVLAAGGYPEKSCDGLPIQGAKLVAQDNQQPIVFHAGTYEKDGKIYAKGGRILCVVALNDTLKYAQKEAYDAIQNISFDEMQYRKDIGYRGIK